MNLFDAIADNVEFMFTDCYEIGSSDVSICVNRVISDIDIAPPISDEFRRQIRGLVNNYLSEFLSDREVN